MCQKEFIVHLSVIYFFNKIISEKYLEVSALGLKSSSLVLRKLLFIYARFGKIF